MIRKQVEFQSNEACEKQLMFTIAEWEHDSLPQTQQFASENMVPTPVEEGKDRLPTISFQRQFVSFREFSEVKHLHRVPEVLR